MKSRKILFLIISLILLLGIGITYSVFRSNANLSTVNQYIAKFIFNAQEQNAISLPVTNLIPGEKKEYLFSVSNIEDEKVSEVDIEYEIIIKTFYTAPFAINLYKINGETENLVLVCDESFSRNDDNELICKMTDAKLPYTSKTKDDYKLTVELPSSYNDPIYAGLVDYIDLEINSWQKIGS